MISDRERIRDRVVLRTHDLTTNNHDNDVGVRKIAIPSRESMHTDEHELYFDEISHEACRVTDFVGTQRVFFSMHAF